MTLVAGSFLILQQFARDFIDLKRCDCLASVKVQYIYLLFFFCQLLRCSDKKKTFEKNIQKRQSFALNFHIFHIKVTYTIK